MKTFLITTLSGLFLLILSGLAWVAGDNPEAFLRLHDKLQGIFRTLIAIPIVLVAGNWLFNVLYLSFDAEKLRNCESDQLENAISGVLDGAKNIREAGVGLFVLFCILIIGEGIFLSLTVISEAMNPEFYKALG